MKLFRRVFSYFMALLFCGTLVLMGVLFLQREPFQCRPGHLESVEKCQIDRGLFTWRHSGWWYLISEGKVDLPHCEQLTEFHMGRASLVRSFSAHECNPLLGVSAYTKCFTNSRLSTLGNTRYYELVAFSGDCTKGLYFEGSKRALVGGKITEMDLENPASTLYPPQPIHRATPGEAFKKEKRPRQKPNQPAGG